VTDAEIDQLADSVSALYRLSPPIDFALIAAEEAVELVEGNFGPDFHGRIEYLATERVFAIYHPVLWGEFFPGRVRFTIAHEFGHYFIPEHRAILLRELVHDSKEDFRSKNEIERQADRFAAALLMPSGVLKEKMGRKGFLALKEIIALSATCGTSIQAASFRYTQFTTEPHLAIISEDRRILYYFASEEASALGFGGIGNGLVPDGSASEKARIEPGGSIYESESNTEAWFSERYQRAELWEEAINLGYQKRVLTLLSWPDYNNADLG